MIAEETGMAPRRVRRLFEADRNPMVGIPETYGLLDRAATVLDALAERMRERAERWEAEADSTQKTT
jgi:hypothetical protein